MKGDSRHTESVVPRDGVTWMSIRANVVRGRRIVLCGVSLRGYATSEYHVMSMGDGHI